MSDPKKHPEARYRQGYEDGAWEVYRALRKFLPDGLTFPALEWLEHRVGPWRIEAHVKVTKDEPVAEITPPLLRLKN
jgi:hypothetical protein